MENIGKYKVEGKLGAGAMGVVFKARDPVLDRLVAIKLISYTLVDEPELRGRFLREARVAANLRHPNIILIYDCDEQDGLPYIVMEYLQGRDLDSLIDPSLDISLEVKLGLVRQVCQGVEHAHQSGIVHRDLKPANIRVLPDGTAKVMDFGIALVADSNKTQTGAVLGTASYMSPEQCVSSQVGPQADVWAAGVILYEMLTFQRPFVGETSFSVMKNITVEPPAPLGSYLKSFPPELEEILAKALDKDPQQRYTSMGRMGEDLQELEALVRAGKAQPVALRSEPEGEKTVVSLPNIPPAAAEGAARMDPTVLAPAPPAGQEDVQATVLAGSPQAPEPPPSQPYPATEIARPAALGSRSPSAQAALAGPAGSSPKASRIQIPLLAVAALALLLSVGGFYIYKEDPLDLFDQSSEQAVTEDVNEASRDMMAVLHNAFYGDKPGLITNAQRRRIDAVASRHQVSARQAEQWEEDARQGWERAHSHFQKGVAEANKGNIQAAIEQLEQARGKDKDCAVVAANLAMVFLADKQFEEAQEMGEEAARLDPEHWLACYVLAAVYSHQGRKEKAIDELEAAKRFVQANDPKAHDQFIKGLKSDPDLEGIRGEERFQALLH